MWNSWFARDNKTDSPRPSVRDVTFDTSGLRVDRKATDQIEWVDLQNDRFIARIDRGSEAVALLPSTLDSLRTYWRKMAAVRGGGIVSASFDRPGGVAYASGVAKFQDGLGSLYEGTILIRFREAVYTLTLAAREHGTTGTREAVVTGLLFSLGELKIPAIVPPATSGTLEGFAKDPYDDTYEGPTLYTLADDEGLDELTPSHPLSKVRRWLAAIKPSLAVADDLAGELVRPPAMGPSENEVRHRVSSYALGGVYLHVGRFERAEQFLAQALPLRNGEPELELPRTARTLLFLGFARENLGRLEEAAWAFERSVRAFSATAGDRHPLTMRARASLGRVYAVLGRAEMAQPLLAEAVSFFEAQQDDTELAVACNALGLVCQLQTDHAEALTTFERSLSLFEKVQGPHGPECATVLRNLARSAEAIGDQVRSKRALKRALEIERHHES